MCNDNFVTNGAVLTCGKTGCGASGCYCCIDYFSVTACSVDYNTTNYTSLCGSTGCICTCGVTEGCYFVCLVSIATSASVGSITCLSASGSGYICNVIVTEGCCEFSTTYGTSLCSGTGCFCTCGVTEGCYFVSYIRVITVSTGVSGVTCLCASGGGYICIVLVTECGYKSFTTYGTSLCIGTGCFCTCGVTEGCCEFSTTYGTSLCIGTGCICTCGVTESGYKSFATYGTSLSSSTGCFCTCGVTESFSEHFITYGTNLSSCTGCCCAFSVAGSCNYFLCNENFATCGAVLTCGKTGCSASRCYCCIGYFGVACCGNGFGIRITARTSILRITVIYTSSTNSSLCITVSTCSFCPCTVDIFVSAAESIYIFNQCDGFDRNFNISQCLTITTVLIYLVSNCFCAGSVQFNNCTLFSGNLGTGCGYVNIALGSIDCTGNVNLCTIIRSVERYVSRFTGGILNRNHVSGLASKIILRITIFHSCPLIRIIDVNVIAFTQYTLCTLFYNQFCTGQNCNVLGDGGFTSLLQNNYKIVGYGKIIF